MGEVEPCARSNVRGVTLGGGRRKLLLGSIHLTSYACQMRYIVGVDEVGRGPIAGPVAVGVVAVPETFEWGSIPGVTDSKKMSHEARVRVYNRARELSVHYAVGFSSVELIDTKGIVPAIQNALRLALEELTLDPLKCDVRLDGGLKAPQEFKQQTTITRGDASESSIGLASIMAKVERDFFMIEQSVAYPQYNFESHKGYGTKLHYAALKKHGLTPLHRRTFLGLSQ